jgi:hypothetical protein
MAKMSEAHKQAISVSHKARWAAMSDAERAHFHSTRVNPKKVPDKDGMRWCRICAAFKNLSEFGAYYKAPLCAICWLEVNARFQVKSKYGLTHEQYEALGNLCAICGLVEVLEPRLSGTGRKSTRRLRVDHSHTTGKVRGKLCNQCNTGIGCFKDRPGLLRLAAAYLDQAESKNDG